MQVVELFVKQVSHTRVTPSDRPIYEAVCLILPESGLGECYLEIIRRYAHREEVISKRNAQPETAYVYEQIEQWIGHTGAWLRTLVEEEPDTE